jgi:hypothetical protein
MAKGGKGKGVSAKLFGSGSTKTQKVPGSSPTNVPAGGPGRSFPQKPFPPPAGKGPPASMRKALAK